MSLVSQVLQVQQVDTGLVGLQVGDVVDVT